MGEGGFSLPANGRIISMFVEWQRRAGGAGTGFTLLGEDDHGGGGRKGLCEGKGAATGVPRVKRTRWPFLLVCFPPYLKKKKNFCCLIIFIGFLLLGIDVIILGGKQSHQERGWGVGLLGAGRSHPKAGEFASRTRFEHHRCSPPSGKILSSQGAPECPHPGPP